MFLQPNYELPTSELRRIGVLSLNFIGKIKTYDLDVCLVYFKIFQLLGNSHPFPKIWRYRVCPHFRLRTSEGDPVFTLALEVLKTNFLKWGRHLDSNKTRMWCCHLSNRMTNRELNVLFDNQHFNHNSFPTYLGVKLDRSLTSQRPQIKLWREITSYISYAGTFRITALWLVYLAAQYASMFPRPN